MKNNIFISFGILFSTILVLIYFFSTPTDWKDFYYKYINPKAGSLALEMEYKKNFDGAADTLTKENSAMSYLQTGTKNSQEIEQGANHFRGYLSIRDGYFTEMLRTDNQALQLLLPSDYKEFYRKRLIADKNDYEAFKIYYKGEGDVLDAIVAETKFNDAFTTTSDEYYQLSVSNNFNPQTVDHFKSMVAQVDQKYRDVRGLATTTGIYSQDLLNYMQREYDFIDLFRKLTDAMVANDKQKEEELVSSFSEKAQQKQPDAYAIVVAWGKEKLQPIIIAQDQKHKKSLDLYNQAYLYARNKNLNDILNIWGNSLPGTTFIEDTMINNSN